MAWDLRICPRVYLVGVSVHAFWTIPRQELCPTWIPMRGRQKAVLLDVPATAFI